MAQKDPTDAFILRMADAIGGLIEFWGFKRHMGRAWTILYFSEQPKSAAELGELLSLSSGAVSMTMNELLKWGVVKKTHRPGERRDYFEPETGIWKMVSRVFRERELQQIEVAIESFENSEKQLTSLLDEATGERKQQIQFALDRVVGLLSMARIGDGLLRAILSGQDVNALPLKNFIDTDGEN